MDKFEAPELFELGSVADVTQANLNGTQYDQTIPAGPIPIPGVDPAFS